MIDQQWSVKTAVQFVSMVIQKGYFFNSLHEHISANNLYSRFQSAYRCEHSTQTALLKIVIDLLLSLDDENVSLLALLDLSAAFDRIDHSILFHRLHHVFGTQGMALELFSSTL